jgi:hypothetical protein
MPKPRRVSAMSTVLKETREYNKVTQEEEQVVPVEQKLVDTEIQTSVCTAKPVTVDTDVQKSVNTETQQYVLTERQRLVSTETQTSANMSIQQSLDTELQKGRNTAMQKTVTAEPLERTHKQTIVISESLAFRLKIHAAKRKETIANIATRAFERLLAEEEDK